MGLSYRNIVPIRGTKTNKYSIIIPAAGMGLRMKSYGVKSLIRLTPQINLITHQLEIIRRTFINSEIILVTGFESDRLMDNTPHDIIKIQNERYNETNVSRSIAIGLHAATSNNIVIIYGDLVFNNQALQIPLKESCLIAGKNIMSHNEVGCSPYNGYVENMIYELPIKWAQIVFLTGNELQLTQELCWNAEHDNMYGFEIFNKVIEKGGKFLHVEPQGIKANDIDSFKDLKTIEDILK